MLEHLKSEIDLPTYDISKFSYTQQKDIIPTINESLDLTATNYAQVSGRRLFILPNILTRSSTKLKQEENRKLDIKLNNEFTDIDSVEIRIPPGFQPEAVPQDMKVQTKFGRYFSSIKVMPDKILYYRSREQYSGNFPAKDYNDLVNFYEAMYKADRSKIVLVKKE
jgi:hypothetical protein